MRILYLHQFFMTRSGIGGTRSYEFARRFVRRGHEVTMLTAAASAEEEGAHDVEGIRVVGVRGGYRDYVRATSLGYGRRAVEFGRFAAAATAAAVRLPKPDVIYATSPPLTMALPAVVASKRHRAPLVFEVRDLWPEAPIQMGALPNPVLQRVARLAEKGAYRAASYVNALSPGMRDGVIEAGVEPGRVTMIPNASDLELFSPEVDGSDFRRRLGLAGRFVVSYFGTMGEANDLTQVVEAATHVPDVAFVLHGDGKRRESLEQLARRRGADNVVFSDPVADKASVARLAAASDVCLTVYKDVPILATCSPNKLFDTFAAGRPAIVNTDGWLRELVERNDAGLFARPGDPEHLAERVAWLRDHPDARARQGRNGRALAEREFSRDLLAERMLDVLERAARG